MWIAVIDSAGHRQPWHRARWAMPGRRHGRTVAVGLLVPVPPFATECQRMPANPLLYEIDTWPWLDRLSRVAGRQIALGDVPAATWDDVAATGADIVWLMGVWRRSPVGTADALADPGTMAGFRDVLPDLQVADVVGSAYCIREYTVDDRLGGPAGLATARAELAGRGIRLLLDFVPNHVAPDHAWALDPSGLCVQGTPDDLARDPASFVRVGDRVLACGRDPFFPAWHDVVQVDAFSPTLRAAAAETLVGILDQCDGVRADMAMLMLGDVFCGTWGDRVGPAPAGEYWTDVLAAARAAHPDALFIAEAYWDLEWRLQRLGFDACYDKRLYDRLRAGDAEGVRLHLCADLDYQAHLVRFIENHDEPRAASVFTPEQHRAAAVVALTQPGWRLVHDGQLDGLRVHLPVFLGRYPDEQPDRELAAWYRRLLGVAGDPALRDGRWSLCARSGWPGNEHWPQLVAWCWEAADQGLAGPPAEPGRWLIVVNLGAMPAAGHVAVPRNWEPLRGRTLDLRDPVNDTAYRRAGDDLLNGLYVDLPPWAAHLFSIRPAADNDPEVHP
jgi:hypothetical protein